MIGHASPPKLLFFISHNEFFSLDRKNKEYDRLSIKDAMDQVDFEKLRIVVNEYLHQHNKKVCSTDVGYYIEFKKEQYDDAFQFYLEIVRTFV